MKLFSVVLTLASRYQSGPKAHTGETFSSRVKITFPAENEREAKWLIRENFDDRIAASQSYELKHEGEAPPGAHGFAITPLS